MSRTRRFKAIGAPESSRQQFHQVRFLLLHLIHCALLRGLVWAPTHERSAVTESVAAEMVVADFDDKLGLERLPFGGAFRRPAARPARRVAGETRRRNQFLE